MSREEDIQAFHIVFMQPIDVSISDAGVPGKGTMRAMPAGTYAQMALEGTDPVPFSLIPAPFSLLGLL